MAYKFQDKTIVPNRQINSQLVEQLFANTSTMDLNEIINFTSNNNLPYNLYNKNGESVLHLVIGLDDSNKKEHQRLNIIKYFIENNVEVDTPDVNNITPLHLACKKQYFKIASYLIEYGAQVNFESSTLMTPLHYVIQGNTTVCKKLKIVDSLIPDIETDKKQKMRNLPEINKELSNLLIQPNIAPYLNNISKTIKDIMKYQDPSNKESISQELLDLQNRIIRLLTNTTSSRDVQQQNIDEQVNSAISNITSKIKGINKFALEDLEFQISNDANSWSPNFLGDIKILNKNNETNLEILWNQLNSMLPDSTNIQTILNKLNLEVQASELIMQRLNNAINNLRIYLNYSIFAGGNPVAGGAVQGQYAGVLAPNYPNFNDNADPMSVRMTNFLKQTDNIVKHKYALTFRDSIMDLENKLYLQGFHNYTIRNTPFNFANFTFIGPAGGRAESLEQRLFLELLNEIVPAPAGGIVGQPFFADADQIPNIFENIPNFLGLINLGGGVYGGNQDYGLLIIFLLATIDNVSNDNLKNLVEEYINIGNVNTELAWHAEQLLENINLNNKIKTISIIQAYLRIGGGANFTYFYKILNDSLEEWQRNNDFNKVVLQISNGYKYNLINQRLINGNGLWNGVGNLLDNIPLKIASYILAIIIPNNYTNIDIIINQPNLNIPARLTVNDINGMLNQIYNLPNPLPQNLIPILGLTLYVFSQLGQIQNTSISDCFDILDNLQPIPPALNIDPFAQQLIQNLKSNFSIDTQESPVELIIYMIKMYVEQNPDQTSIKNNTQLDCLITYLRNTFYKYDKFPQDFYFETLISASFPRFDSTAVLINAENAIIAPANNTIKTMSSIISSLATLLIKDNLLNMNIELFRIDNGLGQTQLWNIPNPDFNNIATGLVAPQNLSAIINQTSDQNIFVLAYLAGCCISTNAQVSSYNTLIRNLIVLINHFNNPAPPLGNPTNINPIILETFPKIYQVTEDIVLAVTETFRKFGLNNIGCLILKEALYYCKSPEIQNAVIGGGNAENLLTEMINNCISAQIFDLDYLGKIPELEIFSRSPYEIESRGPNNIIAYKDQAINAIQFEGTYYLGEFIKVDNNNQFLTAPTINNGSYWQIPNIGQEPQPSVISSLENAMNNRVKRNLKTIKSIVETERQESTYNVLRNILNNNKVGYDYWNNLLDGNFLQLYNLIVENRNLNRVRETELKYLDQTFDKYILQIQQITEDYQRQSLGTQVLKPNATVLNNADKNLEEIRSNFDKIRNFNDSYLEIFNNVNGYNYVNYLLNYPALNEIKMNYFLDGYISKISNEINGMVKSTQHLDTSVPGLNLIPPKLGDNISATGLNGNNANNSYSGIFVNLSNFPNKNIMMDTSQGIFNNSDVIYESSKEESPSLVYTNSNVSNIYLYNLKEHIIKNIINSNWRGTNLEILLDEYIQDLGIEFNDLDKLAYKSIIIGNLSNELLNNYILGKMKEYGIKIVTSRVNSSLKQRNLDIEYNNRPLLIEVSNTYGQAIEEISSLATNKLQNNIFIRQNKRNQLFNLLKYSSELSQKFDEISQNYLYNKDYSNEDNDIKSFCLKIDPKLLRLLFNNYAQINERDDTGQSPIFYAIKNGDLQSLKILLDEGADFNSIPNQIGDTPLIYSKKMLINNLSYTYSENLSEMIKNFTEPFTNSFQEIVLANPNFKNNLPKYSDIAFGQMISIINYKWFKSFFNYDNFWTYNNKKDLIDLLFRNNILTANQNKVEPNGLYILDAYFSSNQSKETIIKSNEMFNSLSLLLNKNEKDQNKNNELINKYTQTINNLNQELADPRTSVNSRLNINNYIGRLQNDNIRLQNENNRLQNEKANLEQNINNTLNDLLPLYDNQYQLIQNYNNRLDNTPNEVYQNILDRLNNSNLGINNRNQTSVYNELWKLYLDNNELLKNGNNIILLINQAIFQITSSETNNTNLLNELKKIQRFHNYIETDIISFFHLPNYLDQNPLLNEMYDIIVNLSSNIIGNNFVLAINNLIYEEIQNRIRYNSSIYTNQKRYLNFIRGLIDSVMEKTIYTNGRNLNISNYIRQELNSLIVKNVLNIKKNKFDTSLEDFESPESIMQRINDLLKMNLKGIIDTEQSRVIDIINQNLIPYYAMNYKVMIPKLKAVFTNYLKYIINSKKQLDILIELLER